MAQYVDSIKQNKVMQAVVKNRDAFAARRVAKLGRVEQGCKPKVDQGGKTSSSRDSDEIRERGAGVG